MTIKRLAVFALLALAITIGAFGQTPTIQYTADYTALTYVDTTGATVTVSFMDSQRFNDLVTIRLQQLQAATDNQTASDNYNTAVKNAQISVNAGRPTPPLPVKPQERLVATDGTVSYVDFSPPLLSIVPLVVTAPSGQISTQAAPDPVAQQTAAMTVIMNQLSAIIAALKAKGIM